LLIGRPVPDRSDIPDANRPARAARRACLEHKILELAGALDLRVRKDVVVAVARGHVAAREQEIGAPNRVHDVEQAQPARPERIALRQDLDLARLAAADSSARDAWNALELRF